MKMNTFKNFALLLAVLLAFSSCASMKIAKNPNAPYIGEWEYTVEDLPVDIDGTLVITEVEGVLNGTMVTPMGELPIGAITITDGVMAVSFDAQGNYIDLGGTFDGDNYTGTLTVQDTDFPMKMTKKQ
jgi:hypothetical protein